MGPRQARGLATGTGRFRSSTSCLPVTSSRPTGGRSSRRRCASGLGAGRTSMPSCEELEGLADDQADPYYPLQRRRRPRGPAPGAGRSSGGRDGLPSRGVAERRQRAQRRWGSRHGHPSSNVTPQAPRPTSMRSMRLASTDRGSMRAASRSAPAWPHWTAVASTRWGCTSTHCAVSGPGRRAGRCAHRHRDGDAARSHPARGPRGCRCRP